MCMCARLFVVSSYSVTVYVVWLWFLLVLSPLSFVAHEIGFNQQVYNGKHSKLLKIRNLIHSS